jgi:microcystin-dependent protein
MSEPFIAEIRMFPYSYAPRNWAWCDGQTIEIAQNTMLYAVIGTTYGGNGTTTFCLPNLQGRVPIHPGRGPGLTYHYLGEVGGAPVVSLAESQMPSHDHELMVTKNSATSTDPTGLYPSKHLDNSKGYMYKETPTLDAEFAAAAVGIAGASHPHENRQPFLTVPFCIALDGIYPPRT